MEPYLLPKNEDFFKKQKVMDREAIYLTSLPSLPAVLRIT